MEFNELRETQVGPLSGQVLDGLAALATAAQDAAHDSAVAAARAESRTRTALLAVVSAGAVLAPSAAASSSRRGSAGTWPASGGRCSGWPTAT